MASCECVPTSRVAPVGGVVAIKRAGRGCVAPVSVARRYALRHSYRGAASVGVAAAAGRRGAPVAVRAAVATDAKDQLKLEIASGKNRTVINELLLQLEGANPTPTPTRSELLTGDWQFAYNAGVAPGPVPSPTRPLALAMYAGGFSPGTFGLAVADMLPKELVTTEDFKLNISGIGPYVSTASIRVKLLGRSFAVKVNCDLTPESDLRIHETYKSLEVYGRFTEVPASLQYERTMFISYLDEDLMIARDETGAPDVLYKIPPPDADNVPQNKSAEEVPTAAAVAPESLIDTEPVDADESTARAGAEPKEPEEAMVEVMDAAEESFGEAMSAAEEFLTDRKSVV